MPGAFFLHFLKDHDEIINQFQIIQVEKGSFLLKVVKGSGHSDEKITDVLNRLGDFIGQTRIDLEYVTEIPLVRTGKRSPVVSLVVEDFQTLEVKTVDVDGKAR
jgi:hypothetical protein